MNEFKLKLIAALTIKEPTSDIISKLENKNIVLYGAGSGLISFYNSVLKRTNINPYVIFDDTIVGNKYNIPIFKINLYNAYASDFEKNDSVVIITVGSLNCYNSIKEKLIEFGWKNIMLASDVYEFHLILIDDDESYRLDFDYYRNNIEDIVKAFDLFDDALSQEIFYLFVRMHVQKKAFKIPSRSTEEQYFPKDICLNRGVNNFINCGAYTGDTVKILNSKRGKINSLLCFEPNVINFEKLETYLSSDHDKIANNITAYPLAVWNKSEMLKFKNDIDKNSLITNEGNTVVQCVALDDIAKDFEPTFINMDIEGAELNALRGAENLIKKNKPDLAISVYHYPRHMWEIPLYLKSLGLEYKFYLRNYTSFSYDTIVYATTI
jgi:FkbM family methyltransferase